MTSIVEAAVFESTYQNLLSDSSCINRYGYCGSRKNKAARTFQHGLFYFQALGRFSD